MFTHLDNKGNAKIVDISKKKYTDRFAKAYGEIHVSKEIFLQLSSRKNKKGDIFAVSKIAGIMAAKNTHNLIPLCHPIKIDDILINFSTDEDKKIIFASSEVKCYEKTGAEMEALTAVTISLLTIYDMCKAVDNNMIIKNIQLVEKRGGKNLILKEI